MTHYYRITLTTIVALATVSMILGISNGPVLAADYPTKSIEMVAWASPGGGSDRMCRSFAKAIEEVLP